MIANVYSCQKMLIAANNCKQLQTTANNYKQKNKKFVRRYITRFDAIRSANEVIEHYCKMINSEKSLTNNLKSHIINLSFLEKR